MEFIRQWKVGDRTFTDKAEAQRYEAQQALMNYTNDELIANADEVIALLRPFATPKRRKGGNGKTDAPAATRARKGGEAQASA